MLGKHFQMLLLKIIKWYRKSQHTSANPSQTSVCLAISTLAETLPLSKPSPHYKNHLSALSRIQGCLETYLEAYSEWSSRVEISISTRIQESKCQEENLTVKYWRR